MTKAVPQSFHSRSLCCLLPLLVGVAGCQGDRIAAVPLPVAPVAPRPPLPVAVTTGKELSQIVERVAPACQAATVGLFQINAGAGSGVIVSPDGLIMTAAHVTQQTTDPSGYILVSLADGRVVVARPLGMDAFQDIAMAKIETPAPAGGWPFAPVGDSNKVKIGDWLVATGNSRGIETDRPAPVRLGRFGTITNKENQVYMISDCAVVSGDSGGPLFNLQGEVVGIHSHVGKSTDDNFHAPSSLYLAVWKDLVAGRQLSVTADKLPEADRKVVLDILHKDLPYANDKELAELLQFALYNPQTKQMRLGVPANIASKLEAYKTGQKSAAGQPVPESIAQASREQLRKQFAKATPEMIESVVKSAVKYTLVDGKANVRVELTPEMKKALEDGDAKALARLIAPQDKPVLPEVTAQNVLRELQGKFPKATPEMLASVVKKFASAVTVEGKAGAKVDLTPELRKALEDGDAKALAALIEASSRPALSPEVTRSVLKDLQGKFPKATPEMLDTIVKNCVRMVVANGKTDVRIELMPELQKALEAGDAKALAEAFEKIKTGIPDSVAQSVRDDLLKKYPKASAEALAAVIKSGVRYSLVDGKANVRVELTPELDALLKGEPPPAKSQAKRDDATAKALFQPALANLGDGVVEIRGDDKRLCLGTVVGADGLVATKASELKGKLAISHDGVSSVPAIVVAKDDDIDLALLRPESPVPGLKALSWAPGDAVLGQVMVIPDAKEAFLTMAVTGVRERPIDKKSHAIGVGRSGVLGLLTKKEYNGPGVLLETAAPGSSAEKAGIKPNDLLVAVNDSVVRNLGDLNRLLLNSRPGDKVKARILRDGGLQDIHFEMGKADNDTALIQPHDTINTEQDLSQRYAPFTMAFQHDGQIGAHDCGGPVLDLQGRVLGINIARLNRVATLAIPADTLQERIGKMLQAPKSAEAVPVAK